MSTTIADHVIACLQSFESVASLSVAESKAEWKINDDLSRFKVWSGNIGAHQRGKSSLDYRLRDAFHLASQVRDLLLDLKASLENACSILEGTKIPWDQEFPDDEDDDESISAPESEDIGFHTEMDQISHDVTEVIKCLMNLSVSIRNPAPNDRFRGSTKTDTSFYEPADISHVREKWDKADPSLVTLLGKANTRRRQYFKYRESHHQKLSRSLDLDFDASKSMSERQSTVASSIPDALKTKPIELAHTVDADELSDGGFTQTSYASSANTSERPRFPALPSEYSSGPFQCPFCFMMINVTTSYAWRKHIFTDLRPYSCVATDCPIAGTEFGRRHQWMQHMSQSHWREWRCVFCAHEPFASTSGLRNHLVCLHSEMIHQGELETAISIGEQSKPFNSISKCPLCQYSIGSVKEYRHHVGRHLEDIALFVLPQIPGEDGTSDDGNSTSSSSGLEVDFIDSENVELKEIEDQLADDGDRIRIHGPEDCQNTQLDQSAEIEAIEVEVRRLGTEKMLRKSPTIEGVGDNPDNSGITDTGKSYKQEPVVEEPAPEPEPEKPAEDDFWHWTLTKGAKKKKKESVFGIPDKHPIHRDISTLPESATDDTSPLDSIGHHDLSIPQSENSHHYATSDSKVVVPQRDEPSKVMAGSSSRTVRFNDQEVLPGKRDSAMDSNDRYLSEDYDIQRLNAAALQEALEAEQDALAKYKSRVGELDAEVSEYRKFSRESESEIHRLREENLVQRRNRDKYQSEAYDLRRRLAPSSDDIAHENQGGIQIELEYSADDEI